MCTPDAFKLVEQTVTTEQRRMLVLVAKPLQNLANGVEFGAKEAFMIPLNALVTANRDRLDACLLQVSLMLTRQLATVPPREEAYVEESSLSAKQVAEDLVVLKTLYAT